MKAKLHGIEIEGTPEEVAQVIKLVGQQPTLPPVAPVSPNPYTFVPWIVPATCDITKPGSGQALRSSDEVYFQPWN